MRAHNFRDLTGHRFGKLIAIRPIERRNRRMFWEFKCDCGRLYISDGANIVHRNRHNEKPASATI